MIDPASISGPQSILHFILRGVSTSLIVRVVGQGLGLLGHMLFSSALGPASYGLYSIVLAWCMLLVVPTKFGLDHVVLRFAPVYLSSGQQGTLQSLFRFCALFLLLSSSLLAFILFFMTGAKPEVFGIATYSDAFWISILVASMAFLGVFSNFFRAAHKIFFSQFYEAILRSALLVAAVLFCLALEFEVNLSVAFLITALSAAVAGAAMLWSLHGLFFRGTSVAATRPRVAAWLNLSWPIFLIAVCQQLMAQSNLLVLGWLSPATEAGNFAVAVRISSFVVFILAAVSSITGPMISVAYESRDFAKLRRIATLSARASFVCAVLIAAVLLFLGANIIALFGAGFGDAYLPLVILISGGLVNAFTGAVGHYLNMTDRQFVTLRILIMSTACSVLLAFLLIPQFGAIGAAWAAALSVTLSNVLMVIAVWRMIGVDTTVIGLQLRTRPV